MSNTDQGARPTTDIAATANDNHDRAHGGAPSSSAHARASASSWAGDLSGAVPEASKLGHAGPSSGWPTQPPMPPQASGADLPIANISRIMKRALPENGKIAKNAKECMQECVSELISFVTSEASDRCGSEKRKTINGDDILYSLRVLGFDNYEQVLKVYLSRYRQAQEENPRQRRRRLAKHLSETDGTGQDGESTTSAAGREGADEGDESESDEGDDA